jgi:hypothetical protein
MRVIKAVPTLLAASLAAVVMLWPNPAVACWWWDESNNQSEATEHEPVPHTGYAEPRTHPIYGPATFYTGTVYPYRSYCRLIYYRRHVRPLIYGEPSIYQSVYGRAISPTEVQTRRPEPPRLSVS